MDVEQLKNKHPRYFEAVRRKPGNDVGEYLMNYTSSICVVFDAMDLVTSNLFELDHKIEGFYVPTNISFVVIGDIRIEIEIFPDANDTIVHCTIASYVENLPRVYRAIAVVSSIMPLQCGCFVRVYSSKEMFEFGNAC